MDGKRSKRSSTLLERGVRSPQMSEEEDVGFACTGMSGDRRALSPGGHRRSRCPRRSIKSPCFEKKSAPKIGRGTAARRKEWVADRPRNFRSSVMDPNVGILDPLAARSGASVEDLLDAGRVEEEEDGKTDTSAPLSTRKSRLDTESKRQSERGSGGDG